METKEIARKTSDDEQHDDITYRLLGKTTFRLKLGVVTSKGQVEIENNFLGKTKLGMLFRVARIAALNAGRRKLSGARTQTYECEYSKCSYVHDCLIHLFKECKSSESSEENPKRFLTI